VAMAYQELSRETTPECKCEEGTAVLAEGRLNHLKTLEAESIYILREAAAEFANPVMLYSIGRDSSVMLPLAQKAFFPGKIPFPLVQFRFGEYVRCFGPSSTGEPLPAERRGIYERIGDQQHIGRGQWVATRSGRDSRICRGQGCLRR